MSLDMTSFLAALKVHYTDESVENMVYKNNPALALISKMDSFTGLSLPLPIIYGNPQNRSNTFADGQAGTSTSAIKQFSLTRVKDYSFAFIDNETMEASVGNTGAFMDAATAEIDGAINSLTRSTATKLFRSGWGDVGVIAASGISGAVVTLATASDACNFEPGQRIVFSDSQASDLLRNSGSALTVDGVDSVAGTVTFTANVSTLNEVVVGDWMFGKGDRENSATPTKLGISGFEAWVPASAPSSTAFFGVDRSKHVTRLGGLRQVSTGDNLEEALIKGASLVAREGHALSHYFVSNQTWQNLVMSLGSKVQYMKSKVEAKLPSGAMVGFDSLRVAGPKGPIEVVADQNCPSNRIFGVDLQYVKLYSLGKLFRILDSDSLKQLRQATADGVEVRCGQYAQLGIRAPGACINIQI